MGGLINFRYNVLNIDSINSFGNIHGGIRNNYKDVYFIRMNGVNKSFIEDVLKLDDTMNNAMRQNQLKYYRFEALPNLSDVEQANYYADCFRKWKQENPKKIVITGTEQNTLLQTQLSEAFTGIEQICVQSKRTYSESMRRNMIIKMMYWFDWVFHTSLSDWSNTMNIKVVMHNVEKVQEYIFLYLLTQIGADVLILQNEKNISLEEHLSRLSQEKTLGNYMKVRVPPYSTIPYVVKQADKMERPLQPEHSTIKMILPSRPSKKNINNGVVKEADRTNPVINKVRKQEKDSSRTNNQREKKFEELALLASSVVMIAIHDGDGNIIGTGSGIMVGKQGYILTNNHVASGGRFYSVRIEEDDQIYKTDEVIKYNSVLDLAIIRITRTLRPIPIYNGKEKLVRGQKVVAIGSPLGLFNSVSNGIISGFRDIDSVNMIQFTAPISHGSSGGAVLNMNGEVIGISTAGIDQGQNINLAVGYESIRMFAQGFIVS